MNKSHKVKIDGVLTVLEWVGKSNGGHQYNTPGNGQAHVFPFPLSFYGKSLLNTNGHEYEILS